jgi:large subunit ribosomal protein L20
MKTKKVKIFQAAKGFFGRRKNCWAIAVRAVHMAWQNAYIGRKLKKRDFRSTWIQQINAGAHLHGLSYAKLIKATSRAGLGLNRKVLADLAATEPYSFKAVVEAAKLASPEVVSQAVRSRRLPLQ